jgi:hypothetical protein
VYVRDQHDGFIDLVDLDPLRWNRSAPENCGGGILIYLVGLLCFFPDVITQHDEARYLEMAYPSHIGRPHRVWLAGRSMRFRRKVSPDPCHQLAGNH